MNKTYQQDERALHIFFLLSLLLHAMIMIYFVQQQRSVTEQTQDAEQQIKQERKDLAEWVETKTRNSTPIYFHEFFEIF